MQSLYSRFFTKRKVRELIVDDSELRALKEVSTEFPRDVFNEIYQYLVKHYRNEYIYKNTLFNKLLIGKHSLNTASAITELSIGDSIADFVLFNGQAVVYEIKTELDSLERLEKQLESYYKAFDFVNVVVAEKHLTSIKQVLCDSPVGITVLTRNMTLSVKQKAAPYGVCMSKDIWFSILRKYEFENVLLEYNGFLPKTNDFEYYEACKSLFVDIPKDKLYKLFIYQLKQRNFKRNQCIDYSMYPESLRSLIYFSNFNKKDFIALDHFLIR